MEGVLSAGTTPTSFCGVKRSNSYGKRSDRGLKCCALQFRCDLASVCNLYNSFAYLFSLCQSQMCNRSNCFYFYTKGKRCDKDWNVVQCRSYLHLTGPSVCVAVNEGFLCTWSNIEIFYHLTHIFFQLNLNLTKNGHLPQNPANGRNWISWRVLIVAPIPNKIALLVQNLQNLQS